MDKTCYMIVAFMLLVMINSSYSLIRCKEHELEALLKFKQSFARPPQNVLSSWVGVDCCQWNGVTCNNVTDNVVKLIVRGSPPSNYYEMYEGTSQLKYLSPALLELKYLSHLDLSYNNFNQTKIPEFIGFMSNLRYLNLSRCKFSGQIPTQLGNITNLIRLDLSGAIDYTPQEHLGWASSLSKLQSLDMSFTDLSLANDTIHVLFRLPSLLVLGLEGSLPQHIACDGCSLGVLELHNIMFSGEIPHWLRHSLAKVIDLSDNLFSGVIFEGENASSLLTDRNYMYVLDLSDNMLSGEIQLKNVYADAILQILSLRGNDFSGLISSQLCNFPQLVILELAQNHFTGHIPRCLGSVRFDSDYSNYAYEDVDIQEIIKGITERFNGGNGIHSMIDLSSNHLVGSVPEELTNISKLMQLNLSNNHFTGAIPGDIGNLQMLESLDLSNNNLSGTIPQSLATIPWLSKLNMSNNRLHGPIPSGSQLQTLDNPSIYAGNSGLYGFPLLNQSTKPDRPQSSTNTVPVTGDDDDDSEDKDEKLWFYLVIMSGVAAGFWGVVGTLIFKKSWRRAYFQYVEDSADKIYVPVKIRTNRLRNRIRKKTSTNISGE